MKKYFLIIIVIFLLFASCRDKKTIVPEISPKIKHEKIFSIEHPENLLKLVSYKDDFFLIYKDGKIIRINSKSFLKDSQYQCLTKFKPNLKVLKNIIVFFSLDENMILFDLNKMNVVFRWKEKQFEKIKYLDERKIIYTYLGNVFVFDYIKNNQIGKIKIKDSDSHDYFVKNNELIVCTKNKIVKFNIGTKKEKHLILKNRSDSRFFFENDILYYCSDNRYLIKFSIKKNREIWSVKLPAKSTGSPIKVGSHIAVILKDYNMYFFNKNGSISWWDTLGATPFSNPLILSENIAIPLRPKKKPSIKFFNINDKKSVLYKIDSPCSEFFFNEKNIYGLSKDESDSTLNIIKIENIYSVEVKILPKEVLLKDKSIEFILEPVNLIKPVYNISIFDSEKKNIYSTEIGIEKAPSFIWFPKKEGEFEVIIETVSENRDKIITNKAFTVIDLKKLQYNFYKRVLSNCTNIK